MGLTTCVERGCPELTTQTRCIKHRKEKRRAEDRRRPNSKQRGYNAKWDKTRNAYKAAFPICQWPQGCIKPTTDVHHLDGKGPLGPRGHDWSNLQGLCHEHHSQITSQDQPGGFLAR